MNELIRQLKKELNMIAIDADYVEERIRGQDGHIRIGTIQRRSESALNMIRDYEQGVRNSDA